MDIRTLSDMQIKKDARVLVRVDFDVAVENGKVKEDYRIRASLSTIDFLLRKQARVRLIAHLGRPEGKRVKLLSLQNIAAYAGKILKREIPFITDPFSADAHSDEAILCFENLRFWKGEEENDPQFARALAIHGDIYINEAFAACHRKHASIAALPKLLPSYAGNRLEQEVKTLENLFENPNRPFISILGGAKIATKLPLIGRFLKETDRVLLAGELANTMLAMKGYSVGKSFVDFETAKTIPDAIIKSEKLFLPSDAIVARSFKSTKFRAVPIDGIKKNDYVVDIGPATVKTYTQELLGARTVVWNGPLGFTENKEFSRGTVAVGRAIGKLDAFSVIGGGDTISVLHANRLLAGIKYVSTGGGAMLAFLAGEKLPGIEALKK